MAVDCHWKAVHAAINAHPRKKARRGNERKRQRNPLDVPYGALCSSKFMSDFYLLLISIFFMKP
jgi:hypothetical protein